MSTMAKAAKLSRRGYPCVMQALGGKHPFVGTSRIDLTRKQPDAYRKEAIKRGYLREAEVFRTASASSPLRAIVRDDADDHRHPESAAAVGAAGRRGAFVTGVMTSGVVDLFRIIIGRKGSASSSSAEEGTEWHAIEPPSPSSERGGWTYHSGVAEGLATRGTERD